MSTFLPLSICATYCTLSFTQSDSSNDGALLYNVKTKRSKAHFSSCRFEPRPLKSTHDFLCGCPQPGILKIGKFLSGENYSNAAKNMQALKSLISCGIWRFLILMFTGEKEHKSGSKMHLKSKKSRSENFYRLERTLENTGFSRVPSLSKNPCFHQTKTGVLVYLGIKKSNI